jgi:hypothetical protein
LRTHEKKPNVIQKVFGQSANSTVLRKFDEQNLSWFEEQRLKMAFKTHDFYVTEFPGTDPKIFPRAAETLYKLIEYIGGNRNWAKKIDLMGDLQAIERFAKINYPFYNKSWNFAGLLKVDPNISVEDFLLHYNLSIILSGMFGLQNKRIDVCIYKKNVLKRFMKIKEFDEAKISIEFIYKILQDSNKVILFYDIPFNPDVRDIVNLELRKIPYKKYGSLIDIEILVEAVFSYNIAKRSKTRKNNKELYWYEPGWKGNNKWIQKKYKIADWPHNIDPLIQRQVAMRDSHYNKKTKKVEVSCRYCSNIGNLAGKRGGQLQFHHIWPWAGTKIKERDKGKIKKYVVQKLNLYKLDYPNQSGKQFTSAFVDVLFEKKHFFSPQFLPKGPTEFWNLVCVCSKGSDRHHPTGNYFTTALNQKNNIGEKNNNENLYTLDGYLRYLLKTGFKPIKKARSYHKMMKYLKSSNSNGEK